MMNLKKNIDALNKVAPGLGDWIEKAEAILPWIRMTRNKNGEFQLNITKESGGVLGVYGDKPIEEAKAFAAKHTLIPNNITVLFGSGCGHLMKSILTKKEKGHRVVVVEPVPQMIRLAFIVYDFSKWILDSSLFIAPIDKDEIASLLSVLDAGAVVENWTTLVENYIAVRPEYPDIVQWVLEVLNQIRSSVGTVMGAGMTIAENDIITLPYIIHHPGVKILEDIFKDKPAVIVCTGPSLEKNIHHLIEHQDKIIIVAVAQALRVLLAYGIRPDFICTVDYGEVNITHFKGLMDSDVPLICLNRTYSEILKSYKGPKFIFATPQYTAEESLATILDEKGKIEQGGSVAHTCMGASILMGCNPIMIIGMDLSLGETSHTMQADSAGTIKIEDEMLWWYVKDPRSPTLYNKSHCMGPVIYVPGYFGESVVTNLGLASFITSAESIIKNHPDKRFINCTEGGARIKGAKQMSFRKALKENAPDKKQTLSPEILTIDYEKGDETIQRAIPLIKKDIEIIDKIFKSSTKALKAKDCVLEAMEITNQKRRSAEMKKWLNENYKASVEAHELAKQNHLISMAIYSASRRLFSQEFKIESKNKGQLLKNFGDLLKRIERNKMILESAHSASERLKKLYEESLKTLEEYISSGNRDLLLKHEDEKPNISDAEEYFDAGNFARPLLEAKRLLEENNSDSLAQDVYYDAKQMRDKAIKKAKALPDNSDLIEYNELVIQAQEEGKIFREHGDTTKLENAEALLEKAHKLFPDKEVAMWGLATVYWERKDTKNALKLFSKLTKKFPDNPRYLFEYGVVMMDEDFSKGMLMVKSAMEKTEEFDAFFAHVGDLHMKAKRYKEAAGTYMAYLEKFPADDEIWEKAAKCYELSGMRKEAEHAKKKIKVDYVI